MNRLPQSYTDSFNSGRTHTTRVSGLAVYKSSSSRIFFQMRGKGWGKKEIDTEQYLHKKTKKKKQKRTNNGFCNTKKHP